MRTFIALALICVALANNVGGWSDVSTNGLTADTTFQKLANFGVSQLGSQLSAFSTGSWEISKVNSVQTQVVSGLNYKIDCELKNTETGATQEVTMVIFYQPWSGVMQLTSATENTINTEFDTVGGWKSLSGAQLTASSNPILASAIEAAMNSLSEQEGFGAQGWTVQKILSVSSQTVAGLNYKINVELVNSSGETQQQQWVVYCQPWSNTYSLTSSQVVGN